MKKLMLGLMMAFAVTAEAEVISDVQIGDLKYSLDTEAKTATLTGYEGSPATVDVSEVEYEGQKYTVTSVGERAFTVCRSLTSVYLPNATTIGIGAFYNCSSLTSISLPNATTIGMSVFSHCENLKEVSLPNATTIEWNAFSDCGSLTSVSLPNATTIGGNAFLGCLVLSSLVVNAEMKKEIEEKGSGYYGIRTNPTITVFQHLSEEVVRAAGYEYETRISVPSVVKSGDTVIDENDYLASCTILDIPPQKKPTEADFKVVSKDAQVIGSDEIAVKKESIQAAKAETISIANNEIQLGVSVMSNSNITAEIANWGKVNLLSENVKVENGNVVITIPVDSASGFMILQSKDAKVQTDLQEPPHTTIR